MTDVVLWHIELSHYNEKARWALDYKRVPHRRRAPLPGTHRAFALALTRGRHDRFPVLHLDGRNVGDSTAIIAALEARHPDPPLYPADPANRARALELEDYFDERLAPAIRIFGWHHALSSPTGVPDLLTPNATGLRRRMLAAGRPLAGAMLRRDYGIGEETAARAREDIVAAMDRLESELGGRDHLVGDTFTVADLAAASLFTPLLAPAERPYSPRMTVGPALELREELDARPGGQWVHATYRRHRGTSAEVAR